MQKIDWLKWHYENNGPFCVMKSGFSHALYMSLSMFVFSILIGISTHTNSGKFFFFSLLSIFTLSIFLVVFTIPLILIHGLQYKIFKKILLQNKVEKSLLVGLGLILTHYTIIYLSIDIIIFKFNIELPAIEFTFFALAYLLGLIKAFLVFHSDYYKTLNHADKSEILFDSTLKEEKTYF